jgi:hypothetical protein
MTEAMAAVEMPVEESRLGAGRAGALGGPAPQAPLTTTAAVAGETRADSESALAVVGRPTRKTVQVRCRHGTTAKGRAGLAEDGSKGLGLDSDRPTPRAAAPSQRSGFPMAMGAFDLGCGGGMASPTTSCTAAGPVRIGPGSNFPCFLDAGVHMRSAPIRVGWSGGGGGGAGANGGGPPRPGALPVEWPEWPLACGGGRSSYTVTPADSVAQGARAGPGTSLRYSCHWLGTAPPPSPPFPAPAELSLRFMTDSAGRTAARAGNTTNAPFDSGLEAKLEPLPAGIPPHRDFFNLYAAAAAAAAAAITNLNASSTARPGLTGSAEAWAGAFPPVSGAALGVQHCGLPVAAAGGSAAATCGIGGGSGGGAGWGGAFDPYLQARLLMLQNLQARGGLPPAFTAAATALPVSGSESAPPAGPFGAPAASGAALGGPLLSPPWMWAAGGAVAHRSDAP